MITHFLPALYWVRLVYVTKHSHTGI